MECHMTSIQMSSQICSFRIFWQMASIPTFMWHLQYLSTRARLTYVSISVVTGGGGAWGPIDAMGKGEDGAECVHLLVFIVVCCDHIWSSWLSHWAMLAMYLWMAWGCAFCIRSNHDSNDPMHIIDMHKILWSEYHMFTQQGVICDRTDVYSAICHPWPMICRMNSISGECQFVPSIK